ncbi:hypothetical protein MRX96_033993 [Rhipicephalus microplus]
MDAPAIMGFHIESVTVKFANFKEQQPSRLLCRLGSCATTMSSNTLVFAVHMITAALFHVLLPLVEMVCTVAPMKHAPSFYHYPNQIAVTLVFASPEERISTSGYSSHLGVLHPKAHCQVCQL